MIRCPRIQRPHLLRILIACLWLLLLAIVTATVSILRGPQ